MDRSKWEYKMFEDCIEKSKKTRQLMTSDYQSEGLYPIISQESSLISGYTNDFDFVNHFNSPVVIFGDHTRVLKYVDFDFAVGADGVKILIPKNGLNAKFLLNYLLWYKVPNLGYSRHYKLLKDISVPFPPIADQQRIVAELDSLNEMIALKQEQLKEFDKLAQSIFYDMFGDPVTNEKGWKQCILKDVTTNITDGDHMPPPKSETGIPFVTISNVNKEVGQIDFSDTFFVPQEYYDNIPDSKKPQVGDVLYTVTGSYGIPILIKGNKKFCFQRHIGLIRPISKINSMFLYSWAGCQSVKRYADRVATGVAQKTVSLKALRFFPIPLPPLSLQQQFAEKIAAIEAQKELVKQSIAETQKLLDYTMDKYFGYD